MLSQSSIYDSIHSLFLTIDLFHRRAHLVFFMFSYIDDQPEFLNVLLNLFINFPIFNTFWPNNQQLSILNNNSILKNDDIDTEW